MLRDKARTEEQYSTGKKNRCRIVRWRTPCEEGKRVKLVIAAATGKTALPSRSYGARLLAGTRTERWARCEGAGAHAETRTERRRNVAEEVAAAGAAAFASKRSGSIGAEPVTAGFAKRIDALHREAGQELHFFSLSGRKAQVASVATVWRSRLKTI